MNTLSIDATKGTPKIQFCPDGELFIEGRSLPEDPTGFYAPVHEWIKKCKTENINLHFKLDYMNTSSSKELYLFFTFLKENKNIKHINVNWHYEEGDDEVYNTGYEFETLTSIPFHFHEYSEILE
jgi:hypothetical protein